MIAIISAILLSTVAAHLSFPEKPTAKFQSKLIQSLTRFETVSSAALTDSNAPDALPSEMTKLLQATLPLLKLLQRGPG
jgi:hypothetical protein